MVLKVWSVSIFIKMFRIKPIRNQTTAKYTYHNQNSEAKATNVIQSKITTIKKPTVQILNP